MKVVALSENTSSCGMKVEHGLCLYIETKKHKILFDFGASDQFVQNAGKLGVDLSSVDIAFLSHGHYDHGTGMHAFLEQNRHANIYMHELVFEPHYNARNEYIGLDATMDGHPRMIKVRGDLQIDDELSFVSLTSFKEPVRSEGLKVKRGKYMENEDFAHEMYLVIHEGYNTYLISGCSHRGLINLIYGFRFDAFIGGFHFMKLDPLWDEDLLLNHARAIKNSCAEYYTCHCTGSEQYQFLKDEIGEKMHYLACGDQIVI